MKFSYTLLKKLLPSVPPKAALSELLNMYVFELESVEGNTLDIKLPANRYSDAASHVGIAREIAAVKGKTFKVPVKMQSKSGAGKNVLRVRVEDKKACLRYAARVFEVPRAIPPLKTTQTILKECGLKSVNGIVDIMNYVMLETGQPLHAFDLDTLAGGELIVRKAKKGESIETLDGQKLALTADTLVIADAERPQAIAGVKGGMGSGVSVGTKRIVVEAANFDQQLTLRTSRRFKLATDAATRFSHGISPALVDWGMARATELLLAAGAKLVQAVDIQNTKITDEIIDFDCARYEALIGMPIDPKTARSSFERLGFKTGSPKGGRFAVTVPAWRNDIENMEGLIEEAVRLYGLNNVPPRPPLVSIMTPHEEDDVALKEKVRAILAKLGASEIYSTSFVAKGSAGAVEVANPISEDKQYLRESLLPLLEECVAANARYFDSVKIFEIGKTFANIRGVKETPSLGIAIGAKKNPKVALELKGTLESLFEGLGIMSAEFVERGESVEVVSEGVRLGVMTYREIGKGWSIALAEFDLEKLLAATEEEKEYVPLKRFPAVMRDISIVLGRDARIGSVLEAIQSASKELIENVDLIDEYERSLTFRIIFQADDRTLTDAEVNQTMEKIVEILKREFKAELR